MFGFKLNYNTATGGTPLYNGNISQTQWKTANTDNSLKTYTYSYDALNRITSGIDNTGHYNLASVSYDKNGNINTLNRTGQTNSGATSFGTMDNLIYTYQSNSNKLTKVTDTANNIYGFKDGANLTTEYTYDVNGNMKTDANKGITAVQYNFLNLPTQVSFGATKNISYIYDASGTKLKKVVNDNGTITTTIYANGFIYENNVLQFFNQPEGYVEPNGSGGFNYVYQYKDHLGNIRLSYKDISTTSTPNLQIIEENNYYPFGLKHKGYNDNINGVANKYKLYNGKELNESLGFNIYEMDLRQYDPALARFTSIDPVTHFSQSTFTAFNNNPILFADPSGADAINGEMVGADGLTNSQWSSFSRPGGGGWDAMSAQTRANANYLANGQKNLSKLENTVKKVKKHYSLKNSFKVGPLSEGQFDDNPDDIRFRDKNGNVIATYYTNKFDVDVFLPVNNLIGASNINLNKLMKKTGHLDDIDIVGIGGNWDFTFVAGGGVSLEAVYFLDGQNSGSYKIFKTTRQNAGLNGGMGIYGLYADFLDGDANLRFDNYLGPSFSLSLGIKDLAVGGYSQFWAPISPKKDKYGIWSFFNKNLRSWTGYTVGIGAGGGLQWSKQNTTLYLK